MTHRKLYVPIFAHLFPKHQARYLKELRACGADGVFLAVGFPLSKEEQTDMLRYTAQSIPLLEDAGFETFVWINAFGFGTPLPEEEKQTTAHFTKITDLDGKTTDSAFCPTDKSFLAFYCDFIRAIVRIGAKAVVLDDDLCLNIRPGLGCVCDEHLRRIGKELKKSVTREELREKVFTGEPNEYRTAWYKVMGDSLREFCRAVRAAADTVNPAVRMGFCAGYTSWDEEGADPIELTRVLAGNTKPFLRYSSAPYWEYTNRFPWQPESHIVEFARQQIAWCNGIDDVDRFTEVDSYPRPRSNVPAFALESFDFMTGASSAPDQLKYLFDYVSSPEYESGYIEAHLQNRPLIRAVSEALGPLPTTGIYVHETKNKFEAMAFPSSYSDKTQIMRKVSFSAASALLCANSIPVTYENHGGITAAFGDAGRTVGLSQKAYILDYDGASELQKRGIDTGLRSESDGSLYENPAGAAEYFEEADDYVRISDNAPHAILKATLSPEAKIESKFNKDSPSSYRYVNKNGMSFLVFLFRGDGINDTKELAASYYRREQIARFCRDMGEPLPIVCRRQTGLYFICKESEDRRGIAFCNYSNDWIFKPLFETPCSEIEQTFGCRAEKTPEGIALAPIPPRSFGAILLKKQEKEESL